jgi:oligopeptide/dipeptide ABC transporter ATP-binding protein
VMYGGQIVETGTVDEVYYQPRMPYTWGLLSSIPRHDAEKGSRLNPIPGAPPVMSRPPAGCRFHPRCTFRVDKCTDQVPDLVQIPGMSAGHLGRCARLAEAGWSDRFVARSEEGLR